jgi:hypothetical protein
MSAPRPRDRAELANLVDVIAEQWPDLSQREIARKLGFKPGVVSGLVARARRNGDRRFPSRPDPAPKVRVIKPVGEAVGNRKPPPPPLTPSNPRLLIDLGPRDCKWPISERDGRHLFCGQPQAANRPYCPVHCSAPE